MELITIVYLIIATVIGAAISYFITKRRKTIDDQNIDDPSVEEERIDQIKKEYDDLLAESKATSAINEERIVQIKNNYEALLAESKDQITQLNEKLKKNIDDSIDEEIRTQLADAEKLKKKVKDLEEEIEEYEDELSGIKKKLTAKENENKALDDSLAKIGKECGQMTYELNNVRSELEYKTQELTLKVRSLAFVQEVLSAKPVNSDHSKDLYGKIDSVVNYVRGELNDSFMKIKSYSLNNKDEIFGQSLDKWANLSKKSWLHGKTTIAFVGEFSAGKTSIVNRILSQDDPSIPLLPVSSKATTAIPTYISGGPTTYFQFFSPDNILKNISEETFKRVDKEVLDQIKGVSSLIQYFVMTYNNPNLSGLSILDTPGFSSNDNEDAERTIGVINECDALFWVFDVNAGTVNRGSIQLIKEHLQKPLYIVINKVDSKSESEVDKVEALIQETLSEAAVPIQKIIRFSAKQPLNDLMTTIQSVRSGGVKESVPYLQNVKDTIVEFVKQIENDSSEANKNHLKEEKKFDNLTNQLNKSIEHLQNACSDAVAIPKWTEHLFSKDRFEMTKDEGQMLQNILETIHNTHVNNIVNIINKRTEVAAETIGLYTTYTDTKSEFQIMSNCLEQFQKLTKNLN